MIMKNQLLNLKMIALMCLMMVLGGANVWAESKTYNYTFRSGDFSTSKHSATLNGVTWTLITKNWTHAETYDFDKSKGFKIGSNKQYPENVTLSTSEIEGNITSIVVNTSGNKGTKAKLDVFVGGKAFGKRQSLTNVATGLSFKGSASGEIELKYSFNEKNPIYIKSIAVTYETAPAKNLTSLAISGQPTKTTYNVGEEFDPTGLVVTGTYDDKSTATITDGITWTKNPKTMSLGNTSCTVKASVGEVNSEPFEVNGLKVVRTISLSIDPTTSTVVKAPVKVTLNATEGATVYYTTNGDEPKTSSDIYNGPFEVTKSETTVKALAVADGADDVKAEATYTIKPDQPVFSDESKTFKDAFNVTLTLPESTEATSEIHYAIGAKATASSPKYEGPINISAENDGDKVILHAVVVDEYGNVGKEKYCTYTKNNAIVFDFAANPNAWGIEPSNNNNVHGDNVVAGKELKVDGVVLTSTNGTNDSNNATCLFKTSGDDITLRVYVGGSITFTAPEGYNLSEVTFAGNTLDKFKAVNYTNPTWTGNVHSVTFSVSSKSVQIKTATIKLVAVEPVQPTFGTLDFKAQDGDEFHYATFSSDKDVVFNQKSVDVFAVSVSNEKVDMNILADASYNVTDATVGSIEKGYYVPANTGVLIVGFDATTTYYFPVEAQTVTLPANQLKPAPANGGVFTAEDGYKYYKLAYDNYDKQEGLGFYWGAPEGGKFFVKAGTAYLAVPAGEATAKGFTLNGEATGIEGVNANVENAKAIYNLNGQRVASMAKPGLYIVNGKKVVVRK